MTVAEVRPGPVTTRRAQVLAVVNSHRRFAETGPSVDASSGSRNELPMPPIVSTAQRRLWVEPRNHRRAGRKHQIFCLHARCLSLLGESRD
jgi:hypothetical protein